MEDQQQQRPADEQQAASSLSELYEAASRAVQAAGSGREPDKIAAALDALSAAEAAVERAALFSSNEDADDVPTSSIKYLLLPSMRAELLAGAPTTGGPQQRAAAVAAALGALTGFLRRAAQLGILKGSAAAAAGLGDVSDGEEDDEEGSSDDEGGASASHARGRGRRALVAAGPPSAAAMDPGARRAAKIERFKRSRALAAAVEQLGRQRAAARVRSGGADGGGDDDAPDAGPTGGPGGWDEEDERRLWLLRVEGAALAGVDTRDSLLQEMQLLRHAAAAAAASGGDRRDSGRGASTSGGGEESDTRLRPRRAEPPVGDAASRAAMMVRLSGIAEALTLNDKERWQQQVFRPYVPLPTITVEQQGAMELAEAQEREARAAEAERKKKAREVERRSDDEDDEALAKARAWDDFKDDNPAGWGNSKLRPCA